MPNNKVREKITRSLRDIKGQVDAGLKGVEDTHYMAANGNLTNASRGLDRVGAMVDECMDEETKLIRAQVQGLHHRIGHMKQQHSLHRTTELIDEAILWTEQAWEYVRDSEVGNGDGSERRAMEGAMQQLRKESTGETIEGAGYVLTGPKVAG